MEVCESSYSSYSDIYFSSLFFLFCMDFSETGINAYPFLSPAEGTITTPD